MELRIHVISATCFKAIEKQFKPGRDRDEATLKEQIRLGRELKLQIDQVEKERLILRDKLTTDEMSPSISNKFLSPRKDMVIFSFIWYR